MDNLGIELGIPGKTISWGLYVHIPFCDYRCRYCDFYFETTKSREMHRRLVESLVVEAQGLPLWWGSQGFGAFPSIQTLYLGGGTPSVLAPELLDRLLGELGRALGGGWMEATLEANPEGVTPDLLELLGRRGINRLSLGIQSLEEGVLRKLGRRAWREVSLASLNLVARRWTGQWSLDIMTGLPGQTWPQLREEMDRLLDFGPSHVSLYSLTLEPGTPLEALVDRGQVHLPDAGTADNLWLKARDRLQEKGWDWYEISNFARPGGESLHNLGYWRMNPYFGLGPGAHGTHPIGEDFRPVRTTQPRLGDYLRGVSPQRDILSPREFFLEHLITGLRTAEGIPWEKFSRRFGLDLRKEWGDRWETLASRGFLSEKSLSGGNLALSSPGRLVLDSLLPGMAEAADRLSFPWGKQV